MKPKIIVCLNLPFTVKALSPMGNTDLPKTVQNTNSFLTLLCVNSSSFVVLELKYWNISLRKEYLSLSMF